MAEPQRDDRWLRRGLFVLVAGAILFVRLVPVQAEPGRLPAPDLLFCLACAWVLRRPDYLPPLLIAAVFLLEDMLTLRPPGLWALAVLLGTEFLRGRAVLLREVTFPLEWAIVAGVMAAAFLFNRIVLAVAFVPQPALSDALLHLLTTVLAYPLAVLASHHLLGVRKPATGEVDALGRRL